MTGIITQSPFFSHHKNDSYSYGMKSKASKNILHSFWIENIFAIIFTLTI